MKLRVMLLLQIMAMSVMAEDRVFDMSTLAEATRDQDIAAIAPDEWMRIEGFKITFDYRTEGISGDAISYSLLPRRANGQVISEPPLIVRKPACAGKELMLISSEHSRHVEALILTPNVASPTYVPQWKKYAKSGKVIISNWKVRPVHKRRHRMISNQIALRGASDYVLHGAYFSDKSSVKIEFAYPDKIKKCGVAVRDEYGKKLRTVKGNDGVAQLNFEGCGYWELEAVAQYENDEKITSHFRVANLGAPISDEDFKMSRYGIMVINFGDDFGRNMGVKWDQRCFFCEKEMDGHCNFTIPDDGRDYIYTCHGLPVIDSLRAPADQGKQGFYPPKDWDEYRAFVAQWFAEHPKIRGKKLCSCGELDFQWRGTIPDFVKSCRIFAEEAKKAFDGDVEISGPEASRIKIEYLNELADNGFFEFNDAINIHHYVDGDRPEALYLDDLYALEKFTQERKLEDKPIYITESGWSSAEGGYFVPVTELKHGQYVTRAMALMSCFNIQAIIWHVEFCFNRNPRGPCGFSLIQQQNEALYAKTALPAFTTVTRNLSDITDKRMKLRRLDAETYLVSGNRKRGEKVHVLWKVGEPKTIDLPVEATRAEDYVGRKVSIASGKVTISESPIYLFGPSMDIKVPEWVAPKEAPKVVRPTVKTDGVISRLERGDHEATHGSEIAASKWSDKSKAPTTYFGWSTEGFFLSIKSKDPAATQLTLGFDIDKAKDWEPNEIYMGFKGHRCVEYQFTLNEDGTGSYYRRGSWIPDVKANVVTGTHIHASVSKASDGSIVYWLYLPWASFALDSAPSPGSVIGVAAALGHVDVEGAPVLTLGGGLLEPLDPMKYLAFELK